MPTSCQPREPVNTRAVREHGLARPLWAERPSGSSRRREELSPKPHLREPDGVGGATPCGASRKPLPQQGGSPSLPIHTVWMGEETPSFPARIVLEEGFEGHQKRVRTLYNARRFVRIHPSFADHNRPLLGGGCV